MDAVQSKRTRKAGPERPIRTTLYHPDEYTIDGLRPGFVFRVLVPRQYLVALPQKPIWGTHYYTEDSHLLVACVHDGRFVPFSAAPMDDVAAMVVVVKICPPLAVYGGSVAHGVTSLEWTGSSVRSFRIMSCRFLPKRPGSGPAQTTTPLSAPSAVAVMAKKASEFAWEQRLFADERYARRTGRKAIPGVTIQFGEDDESPWMRYSVEVFNDCLWDPQQFLSYRLSHDYAVFYAPERKTYFSLHGVRSAAAAAATPSVDPNAAEEVLYELRGTRECAGYPTPAQVAAWTLVHGQLKWPMITWDSSGIAVPSKNIAIHVTRFIIVRGDGGANAAAPIEVRPPSPPLPPATGPRVDLSSAAEDAPMV